MAHSSSAILEADKLSKKFYSPIQIEVLKSVSLSVFPGDSVAITGKSGQGKSTLLQLLGTLDSPTTGTLKIAGTNVSSFNRNKVRNEEIAFIFQSFHLLEDYTALENILMPAYIGRKDISKGSAAYNRALELLSLVGLSDRAHFHTKLLSGGEKQRTAIARALCNDPKLILADEPSGNLDKETAEQIYLLLENYISQSNKALIVVTHDPLLAKRCNKQYWLENGRLEPLMPC